MNWLGRIMNQPEKENLGPGSVGSTQRRPPEAGSLTQFSPPRPLHMIPCYHGRTTFAKIWPRLKTKGEYSIYIDQENAQLTLCVRGEKEISQFQIMKRQSDGKFIVNCEKDHSKVGFTNVEELITYYDVYGLEIQDKVIIEKPINVRADNKPPSDKRRPFRQLKELAHFHGALNQEEAEKLCKDDGDFLLREDANDRGKFILTVRGKDNVYLHHVFERDPLAGGYALPRDNDETPVECVAMIDEWVQFHLLFSVPVAGNYALIKAVTK